MWRRVSCEQPLDTSQSILRLSGSIVQWRGESELCESGFDTAATAERETGSYSCTRLRNRPRASLSTWQHEQSLRRPPEPWEELSFLHKRPDPWNHFAWRMGFGRLSPRAQQFSLCPWASGGTLKIKLRATAIRTGSYPYPQQVS